MNSIINLWNRILTYLNFRIDERELKHKRVILNPNNFLDNEVVFYFESRYYPDINNYLSANYYRINKGLEDKGMRFVYIPLIEHQPKNHLKNNLLLYIKYKYPELLIGTSNSNIEIIDAILQKTDIALYYQILGETLGIPEDSSPCFIHSIDFEKDYGPDRKWKYSIFSLYTENKRKLHLQVNYYLEKVSAPSSNLFFSLKDKKDEPYDADERFFIDGHIIRDDIKQAIDLIKNISSEKVLLSSLVYLINALKEINPEICKRLNENIFNQAKLISNQFSKIVIDEKYRILLPDYQNLEIELTPLPKTFYLFMLKHPEGIMFKELSNYRDELIGIYSKVGNRYDMDQIQKSIFDLTDIKSNSVNEKCSRIKEAFLNKIDDSIAKHYYITGDRNDKKLIRIDRSLVIFKETL